MNFSSLLRRSNKIRLTESITWHVGRIVPGFSFGAAYQCIHSLLVLSYMFGYVVMVGRLVRFTLV